MIVDYIDSHRDRFGVEPICAVLAEAGIAIAPSTYYARSKAARSPTPSWTTPTWPTSCGPLWQENWGVYGARKLWHAARRAGHDVGRDQVARLMRIVGIAGVVRGKHRTVTTTRDASRRGTRIWSQRGWDTPRERSTSCGPGGSVRSWW